MSNADLANIATTLKADGKGILTADETVGTLTKRFDALGRSTEQSRRTYREMLFTARGAAEFPCRGRSASPTGARSRIRRWRPGTDGTRI